MSYICSRINKTCVDMRYLGSKSKYLNDIQSIIEKNLNKDEWYVEPFLGGANIFSHINHPLKAGIDNNEYVIAMWNEIKNGTFIAPTNVSKMLYYDIKKDYLEKTDIYPFSLIGYVGNACSNGSAWWNGYANYNHKRNENHITEARDNINRQIASFKFLKESVFVYADYKDLILTDKSFIYCDPPYANTKKYETDFDNDKFWNWCRDLVMNGHKVLVSEYDAPNDFICIWSKEKKDGLSNSFGCKQNVKIEKLFIHESQTNLFKI